MSLIMAVTIPGKPFGKQRPRFSRASGTTYTPKETAVYENLVKTCFCQKYPTHIPTENGIRMTINAFYEIPKSWSNKKKDLALLDLVHPSKPDWDNAGKIISDALNGIAYKDDAQIYDCRVTKSYSEQPHVLVTIIIDEREETKK